MAEKQSCQNPSANLPAIMTEVLTVPNETEFKLDLGNLVAFSEGPLDIKEFKTGGEKSLIEQITPDVQKMVTALFNLPVTVTEDGPRVTLPRPTTQLPREKPIPKPKEPTRWDKYAKEKGIMNKKRSRKVWDDESKDWIPRWGAGSKKQKRETDQSEE